MNCAVAYDTLATQASVSPDDAMALFDSLEPVGIDFMLGRWRGKGFPTGHRMDGLMEHLQWYGKAFESSESVHPLVFQRNNGELIHLNPIWFPIRAARRSRLAMSRTARRLFSVAMPLFKTRQPAARLRMTEYRGKVSATMVYDYKAINDVFRKIDENRVLGVMDCKGEQGYPFFFVLERV